MKRTASLLMTGLFGVIFIRTFLVLSCSILIASCTSLKTQRNTEPTPGQYGNRGYILVETLPNTLALLPPPPSDDSAIFKLDQEMSRNSFSLRDTPRWELATRDGMMFFPEPVDAFSCSLGASITEKNTPNLYTLLNRIFFDVDWFDKPIKDQYKRPRPFVVNNEPICTTTNMKKYTSYPSGTAALGWAYALILSEISPDKTEALLSRGLAYGETNVICNQGWYSDMVAGRVLGAALVARLHTEPEFLKHLSAAKHELAAARAKGLQPERDCEAEAAAMTISLESIH